MKTPEIHSPRILNLRKLLGKSSFFLLGPRATGKTQMIRRQLGKHALVIDLLQSEQYLRLTENPSLIEEIVAKETGRRPIVIDEVQRIPMLLNEVHRLIETRRLTFLLTGSSARKLKRKDVNLLAGRAWRAELFPLTWRELGGRFDLDRFLRLGGLPQVYLAAEPEEVLWAYCDTYLEQEIQAEALVRNISAFSRFLKVAALCNGRVINFSKIGSDAGVAPSTVRQYFGLLEDTLLGFELPAWKESKRRKATQTSKFYLFDTGVARTLAQTRELDRNSDLYGRAFEHFIAGEVRAYLSYRRIREPLCHWRTKHGHEVDILVGNRLAVEVKASRKVSERDLTGLRSLAEEGVHDRFLLVSQDPIERKHDRFEFLPWKVFLKSLWNDQLLE